MEIIEILILGIVQGITEFFPVSSSGHLVAARILFGISDVSGTAFDAVLHLGTLLAVLVYFWKIWRDIFTSVFSQAQQNNTEKNLLINIFLATLPAAFVGYLLQEASANWRTGTVVGIGMIITAVALLGAEKVYFIFGKEKKDSELLEKENLQNKLHVKGALFIGFAQILALVPGVSRSGITISAGQILKLNRKQAVTFSFLMSAPIIAGAGLFGLGVIMQGSSFSLFELTIGFLVSFASGLFAIRIIMKMIEKISFIPFAVYLVFMAGWLIYVG